MESISVKNATVKSNDEDDKESSIGASATSTDSQETPHFTEDISVNNNPTKGESDVGADSREVGHSSLKGGCIERDNEKTETKEATAPNSKKTENSKDIQMVNSNIEVSATANTAGDDATASSSLASLSRSIPRKKRRRLERESLHDGDGSVHSDRDETDSPMNVSLAQLKRQVLGRDLKVDENENDWEDEDDAEISQIRALMNASDAGNDNRNTLKPVDAKAADNSDKENEGLAQTKTNDSSALSLAEKLRNDLMCAICHEVVYPPVSLPCGHSFCQSCIGWWLDHDDAGRCPTCRRRSYPEGYHHNKSWDIVTSPNLALRACVMAMFGPEIVQRIQNRKKMRPKGEKSGEHDGGYQVLSKLQDETWHYVGVNLSSNTSPTSEATIGVRRSIVLDAEDQRMQLALAVYEKPIKDAIDTGDFLDYDSYSGGHCGSFRVQLCLLTMEEDEAVDSGFPTNVLSPEDELFVCGSSRSCYSHLDVQMKDDYGNISPLARVSADSSHGRFEYFLNPSESVGNVRTEPIRALLFEHSETGLQLEIDLSRLQNRAGGSSRLPPNRRRQRADMIARGHYYSDEDDESENQNEFEDDGFLVGDEESNVEGAFSDEEDVSIDEGDRCAICKDGGELMVCDGGDKHPGCGKSFHAECVNRSAIPDGDWICQDCAKAAGIETDIAGHEFREPEEASGTIRDEEASQRDATGDVDCGSVEDDSDVEGAFSDDDDPKDAESQRDDNDCSAENEILDFENKVAVKPSGNNNKGSTKRRFVLEDSDSD